MDLVLLSRLGPKKMPVVFRRSQSTGPIPVDPIEYVNHTVLTYWTGFEINNPNLYFPSSGEVADMPFSLAGQASFTYNSVSYPTDHPTSSTYMTSFYGIFPIFRTGLP